MAERKKNSNKVNFGRFEKEILSEKIAERILSLIKERQLRPGDSLPPERELAALMAVSRPSLREALRALSIMNVIEHRHGSGTFVTSLEPELLVEHLELIFTLHDNTYLNLLQARKVLEAGLAELAAASISDAELTKLEDCLTRSAQSIDDPEAFLQIDLELHKTIADAARNDILRRIMAGLARLVLYSRRRTSVLPEVRNQTLRDHRAIVTALKARDPRAARQAMLDHLNHVEEGLKKVMASTQNPPGQD